MAERTREEVRAERRQRIDARAQLEGERDRRRKRRTVMRVGIPIGIGALLLLGILGYAVFEATRPLPGEAVAIEGSNHVDPGTPINYTSYPPSSGTHFPSTARWGFSESAVLPGFWVHNLEHGGIVVLYKCPSDCTQLKNQLRSLQSTLPASPSTRLVKVVMAPDDRIETSLVALAWGRRMPLETFDEGELRRFYQALLEAGTAPEPFAG